MKEETTTVHQENDAVLFSAEEYLPILKLVDAFVEKGIAENPPKFVVFMGGIASGKTTIRRQRFSNGYVNFELGDILAAAKKVFGEDNPKLPNFAAIASEMILRRSLEAKKNMVIEIIGDKKALFDPIFHKMGEIGYKCEVCLINCDPAEGYKRHLKAVAEDKDYLSAHFTQDATLSYFYHQLGLDQTPPAPALEESASDTTFSRVRKWFSRKPQV